MVLYTPPRPADELGFYMPYSPFAKIAEVEGLDFNDNKKHKKAEQSIQAKANDVFDEHHIGRRWNEKHALMSRHTGAFLEVSAAARAPTLPQHPTKHTQRTRTMCDATRG